MFKNKTNGSNTGLAKYPGSQCQIDQILVQSRTTFLYVYLYAVSYDISDI